ncbi:MAG: ABC transporter substrate-binding protein [Bacteroidota bacterium]|nr:ABC transporter substrate-binding protein [Bacteroidota bacterium]
MKNLFRIKSWILLSVLLIGLSQCKKAEEIIVVYEDEIELGVILPLDQEKGLLRLHALELAIDQINSEGGVGDGLKIKLKTASSAGEDRRIAAAAAARQLIDEHDNMLGLISCFSSSSLGIVENISKPDQFPTISGAATSSQLSGISSYFQRLCPPDEFEASILSDQANQYGITKLAIAVEEGDAYSENLAEAFQQSFGAGADTKISFTSDDPDYGDKINQLLAGDPEAIFISMLNPDEYLKLFSALGQINRQNSLDQTRFILCDALYSGELLQAGIEIMLGEINGHPKNFGAFPSADTSTDAFVFFKTKLWEKYNQEVASYNAQYFDIGYLYALAIEKSLQLSDINNPADFRVVLNQQIRMVSHGIQGDPLVGPQQGWKNLKNKCKAGGVDYSGASGNCNIDEEGNAATAYSIFKMVKNGNEYDFEIIKIIP